jgi:hypothetical protein
MAANSAPIGSSSAPSPKRLETRVGRQETSDAFPLHQGAKVEDMESGIEFVTSGSSSPSLRRLDSIRSNKLGIKFITSGPSPSSPKQVGI